MSTPGSEWSLTFQTRVRFSGTVGTTHMYFEQFFLSCLAHASYMLGSGELAAVVDPQRDVDLYLEEADMHGLRIAYVIETHLHADFVSGHRELAESTGAQIYVGAKAGATFPHVPVRDGDEIRFGDCQLRFLETPGHTEESLCVLVSDLAESLEPSAILTGDTLFIGDVGRPDLSATHTPQQLAGMLYRSLHEKVLKVPDSVQVYPAHGAGSLCGRYMSTDRSSTIGREKATNYALQDMTSDAFVRMLTAELPERPGYFSRDVEINRSGAPALAQLPPLPELDAITVLLHQRHDAIVLDTRQPSDFAASHIPGSINIALSGQYASWAGSVIGLGVDIVLLAQDEALANQARLRLARVGVEAVVGYLKGGIETWRAAGLPLNSTGELHAAELRRLVEESPGDLQLLDVRRSAEWVEGHLPGAVWRPLTHLLPVPSELDPKQKTVVYCKAGYRGSIAASLLQRAGFSNVANLIGGIDAWNASGLEVVQTKSLREET